MRFKSVISQMVKRNERSKRRAGKQDLSELCERFDVLLELASAHSDFALGHLAHGDTDKARNDITRLSFCGARAQRSVTPAIATSIPQARCLRVVQNEM